MKTAMQELVEQLEFIKLKKTKNLHEVIFFDGVLAIIDAGKYLEKEKEQIQKAFSDGQETPINHPTLPHYSREEYYDECPTYEEAELACLKKLIEIVKEIKEDKIGEYFAKNADIKIEMNKNERK
jgi:hypothetical protein